MIIDLLNFISDADIKVSFRNGKIDGLSINVGQSSIEQSRSAVVETTATEKEEDSEKETSS